MKTAETITTSSNHNQSKTDQKPFFNKGWESPFFSAKDIQANSFFNTNLSSVNRNIDTIQQKLTIGQTGDKYEVEADRTADLVVQKLMNTPNSNNSPESGANENIAQLKCPECEQEEKLQSKEEPLVNRISTPQPGSIYKGTEDTNSDPAQRNYTSSKEGELQEMEEEISQEEPELMKKSDQEFSSPPEEIQNNLDSFTSSGTHLPKSTREKMESTFGADFSKVRVHTGSQAIQMNNDLNAQAFTHGNDIYFNKGKYDSDSLKGQHLLAHELTHVLQQSGNSIQRLTIDTSSRCQNWGGFRICGSNSFKGTVLRELDILYRTTQGSGALREINRHRDHWYRPRIYIDESSACGFLPVRILYNPNGCSVTHRCPGAGSAWQNVPNYIYLFHEICHVYEYLIGGRGTHSERECMVTGLGNYFNTIPYNENKLRCELGQPVRPCYDNPNCTAHSAPGCSSAGGSSSLNSNIGFSNAPVSGQINLNAGRMINREVETSDGDPDTAEVTECRDQNAIRISIRDAGDIIRVVRRRLRNGPNQITEDDRINAQMRWFYILFFHVEPNARSMRQIQNIEDNFNLLEHALSAMNVRCGTSNHPDCSSGEFSHMGFSPIATNSSPTIYLCPNFFHANTDRYARARTIIHELAHGRLGIGHNGGRFINFGCNETPMRTFDEAIDNAYVYDNFAMCLFEATPEE